MTSIITAVCFAIVAPNPAPLTLSQVKSFTNFRATALAVSTVGNKFAVASEDLKIRVIDLKAMQTVATMQGHPMTPYAVTFSRDGKVVASGDETARILLWDAKTGKKIREFPRDKGHKRGIQALAFSADGKQLVSVGKDDVILVWNTSGGHPVKTIPGNGANFYGVALMKDGSVATATLSEGMRVYKKGSYDLIGRMKVDSGQGANDVAVNVAGTLGLTAGRDGKLVVWDMKSRKTVASLKAHDDWVLDVDFAPNGRVAVSCSSDARLSVVDVKSLKVLATLEGRAVVDSLVGVTADGKYVLTTDGANNVQVYQFSTPQK